MILAIDTATRTTSIALHDGDILLSEQTWITGNDFHAKIASIIADTMDACDVSMDEISGVAVCHGPGSYTGTRIGVAFGKGIAAANNLPLIGVSTLDIVAAGTPVFNSRHRLIAVAQAGRGRIIPAIYTAKKGRWVARTQPDLTTWDDLIETLEAGTYHISGELGVNARQTIQSVARDGLTLKIVSGAHGLRRAGFLAQVAWERLLKGDRDQFKAAHLAPVYLKSPG